MKRETHEEFLQAVQARSNVKAVIQITKRARSGRSMTPPPGSSRPPTSEAVAAGQCFRKVTQILNGKKK
jgi:hypothetical protein